MKLPKAFYTVRVREALGSLADHVTSAYNNAADLKALKVPKVELVDDGNPKVIITSVRKTLQKNKEREIEAIFEIRGKNLGFGDGEKELSVSEFALVPEGDFVDGVVKKEKKEFSTVNENINGTNKRIGFGVKLNIQKEKLASSYDVRITDSSGNQHFPGFTFKFDQA